MTTRVFAGLAVASIALQPALADPLPNPASKLSLSKARPPRASARLKNGSKLTAGGYVIGAVAIAAAIGAILILSDNDEAHPFPASP